MAYRDVLNAVHAIERMTGQALGVPPSMSEKPTCPDHPTAAVQWSNVRETYRCSVCQKALGK